MPAMSDPSNILPSAYANKGQLLPAWPAAECTWVPAYIAYGLLENLAFDQNIVSNAQSLAILAGLGIKGTLAPKDQELHQQMLQKLALHLAAQPEASVASQVVRAAAESLGTKARSSDDQVKKVQESRGRSLSAHDQELQKKSLSAHDQDFQQEMLRKLALHLAAQGPQAPMATEQKDDVHVCPSIASSDVFPATPSSFGDEPCEHFFIGDECSDQKELQPASYCCWPASSQLVSVPLTVAHGLMSLGQGQDGHEFHQQMLKKLALHLAAQWEEDESSKPVAVPPEQCKAMSSTAKAKASWADMTEDDDSLEPAMLALRPPVISCAGGSHLSSCSSPERKKRYSAASASNVNVSDQEQFQKEMLRRLALHLAAQPEVEHSLGGSTPEPLESVEFAKALGEDKARCVELLEQLEPPASFAQEARVSETVALLLPGVHVLSLTQGGSRLVQQMIDVSSIRQCDRLVDLLLSDAEGIAELYTSPHANHVIAKIIVAMSSNKVACIGEAMRSKATTIARHQFGSRILERLIEHCSQSDVGFLYDELLEDCEPLARHQFGNFVIARMLEHGVGERKERCLQKLLPFVLQHATHKTACNIVQRIMENADLACQAAIADTFLAGTGETSLEAIAATRYGSFVIQHLVDKFHPRIDAVKARVKAAHSQLQQSGFSQRQIVRFLGESFFRD